MVSGALWYVTAEALEEALGDVLRSVYQGMGHKDLQSTLGRRLKTVLVSLDVCRKLWQKYGQPAASSSSAV